MSQRNRSEGWQHAKRDGHDNEKTFGDILTGNPELANHIWRQFHGSSIPGPYKVSVDGSKRAQSSLGGTTTSKVDIELFASNKATRISVKKSSGGQVWLVSVDSFLNLVRLSGDKSWSDDAIRGLKLFIGGASNVSGLEETLQQGLDYSKTRNHSFHSNQVRYSRLSATDLRAVDSNALASLVSAIKSSMSLITRFAFASGAAANEDDWANTVVYNNSTMGTASILTQDLANYSEKFTESVTFGPRNGGTTIVLPWGFLQEHHPQGNNLMQFHHKENLLLRHYPDQLKHFD
jgi:hypothetical protein